MIHIENPAVAVNTSFPVYNIHIIMTMGFFSWTRKSFVLCLLQYAYIGQTIISFRTVVEWTLKYIKYSLTWRKRLVHSLIAADVVTHWGKRTHWLMAVHLSTGSFKRAKCCVVNINKLCKHQYTIHKLFIKSSITQVDLLCKAIQQFNSFYLIE